MALIECNEINQVANELKIAFEDCKKLKSEDMQKLVDLILAVNTCANGGVDYGTLISTLYEPVGNQIITLPVDTFHSITVLINTGSIIYNGVTLPAGASINLEVTSLNQTEFEFEIVGGSKVLVEYLIETV